MEPIVQYPWRIQILDEDGRLVGTEEPAPSVRGDSPLGCLYVAFEMLGGPQTAHLICGASGSAFRFGFDGHLSAFNPSPVNALATVCDALGFDYALSCDTGVTEATALIEQSIDGGFPVLWGGDFWWRLLVGYDKAAGEYYYVGGPWRALKTRRGQRYERLLLAAEQCHRMKIPKADWLGPLPTPAQFARNTVFVVKGRRGAAGEEPKKRLKTLVEIGRRSRIKRVNLDLWSRYCGRPVPECVAITGAEGIRPWAKVIESMAAPTHDHKVFLRNEDLAGALSRAHRAPAYLRWLAARLPPKAAAHLEHAAESFEASTRIGPPLIHWTCTVHDRKRLNDSIRQHAALVYVVDEDKEPLLDDDLRARSRRGPAGLTVLPDAATFGKAKDAVVMGLRRIAELREQAFTEIENAAGILRVAGEAP